MHKTAFFLLTHLFLHLGLGQQKSPNIILVIGDGTGLSQITAGMYANGNKTHLESFPVVGLAKTHSLNALVTDSAASGTAMACGVKTYNGTIGIDGKNVQHPSILEYAEDKNYTTGMITTSSIVHATPASFYAKVPSRSKYQDIALQLKESDLDYFIGGGKKHFTKRKDNRNLVAEMTEWTIVNRLKSFDDATTDKVGYFTNYDEPLPILEGRKPDLADAVRSMLQKFEEKQAPFFMMVEGSQIDWGGHANDLGYIVSEFLDMDEAIGVLVDYVNKHPNTLLIVTADHETGGLGISSGNRRTFQPKGGFVTGGHTASMVPVFAKGLEEQLFSGIYENTAIFEKMMTVLNRQ